MIKYKKENYIFIILYGRYERLISFIYCSGMSVILYYIADILLNKIPENIGIRILYLSIILVSIFFGMNGLIILIDE